MTWDDVKGMNVGDLVQMIDGAGGAATTLCAVLPDGRMLGVCLLLGPGAAPIMDTVIRMLSGASPNWSAAGEVGGQNAN